MPVLNRDFDGFPEVDRILDVEAIQGAPPGPVRPARERDPAVRPGERLRRAPGVVEVVLGARAVEARRKRLAVDEDHVVALAVPVPRGRLAEVVDVEMA